MLERELVFLELWPVLVLALVHEALVLEQEPPNILVDMPEQEPIRVLVLDPGQGQADKHILVLGRGHHHLQKDNSRDSNGVVVGSSMDRNTGKAVDVVAVVDDFECYL